MASVLHSGEPLECSTHHCPALQVQEILTRTPREHLQTHGHIAVARSMEFNKDSLGVVRVLLEQPEIQLNLPELEGEEGNTLLHSAVLMHDEDENEENRKCSVLLLILKRPDIDPNVRNSKGDTPLHSAARASSVSCVDILLDDTRVNVAAVNYIKQTSLHVACEASSKKTCDRIASKIIDSARSTVRSFPQFLRKQDQFGNTGLHYAAARGLENVVDAILEAESLGSEQLAVKQNHQGNLAIHLAAKNGHHGAVKRMLLLVDDVILNMRDQDGFGLLHHAVVGGCQEILQLCIRCLPEPTRPTFDRARFDLYMELLAVARDKDIADFLLQRLDETAKNSKGKEDDYLANLLHFAVSEKRETLVELIVKWYPKQAVIAMHEALEMRNETIQTVLRDHPEVQREFVKLHKAYTYYVTAANAILVVAVLIVTVTFDNCMTPLEAAQRRKDIIELQEYGEPAPGSREVQFHDFVIMPRWAFFQAMLATILAAFAALPFSFAIFFHEAVDDAQVKRLLYKTRVLIVSASYFLMLSIEALVFSFVCSQYFEPFTNYKCARASEIATGVFLLCSMLFLGFNFVRYWRTKTEGDQPGIMKMQKKLTITIKQ